MNNVRPTLQLKAFTFAELLTAEGLARLDQAFLDQLALADSNLHQHLINYRLNNQTFTAIETSELLISWGLFLEQFLAELFQIKEALHISQLRTVEYNPISVFKKYFVLRRARKEVNRAEAFPSFAELNTWLEKSLSQSALKTDDLELATALLGSQYLAKPEIFNQEIELLVQWCTQALRTKEGQQLVKNWTSFHLPKKLDFDQLINNSNSLQLRLRDGFDLTDERMSARTVQDEVNYCIYCHDHEGDFCSIGFPVKKGDPDQGFKKNPADVTLTGCPLEEKISEMNYLKKNGHTIASLAMVMVDNPMCPATGHRICNDCMKSCIYQKQEPVNIPQIETRVLTDVLDLPWGVEIYDLLTRWHPLRHTQWGMKPYNGLKIMIAGMGPAGFTLAHHLLLDGFAVVGFDGLKIEPFDTSHLSQPVYDFDELKEKLSERIMAGFGGVAEYGITVRWDKNFLKLIYLSLMRKPYFQVFGGIRFGGTLTIEDAWKMGFDHFVIAVGAGLPKALSIPNSMAPGMRQANDFLMALQLGNAAKSSSLTSLQIRLPAVIIGGGLTGVDTATEVQAYYIALVEKTAKRYYALIAEYGKEVITNQLDSASRPILEEYLAHAEAISKERAHAKAHHKAPNFISLIHAWGGVTIAYRKTMQESPAYINNHEELQKALEEGIYYREAIEPKEVELDLFGHTQALLCNERYKNEENEWVTNNKIIRLPARSILVATGTQPNTAYEFEHRGTFNRLNLQYQHYEDQDGQLITAHGALHCKDPNFGPFTSYGCHPHSSNCHPREGGDHRVSLIGDTHPIFHGSVVKAIASGSKTYPKIVSILKNKILKNKISNSNSALLSEYQEFSKKMEYFFRAKIISIIRKRENILELSIEAPLAAKNFQPGQFYRLQNFETFSSRIDNTLLQMEPLICSVSECNREKGILNFIIHEKNVSSKLCALLKPNEWVSLMGPTGVRAKIPQNNETILIVGNINSFAYLRSFGKTVRELGNRVLYLGYFTEAEEVYCQSELENASDVIIWLTKRGQRITPNRPQDYSIKGGDIIGALIEYSRHKKDILLSDIDKIFLIGETELLRSFQTARHTLLKSHFIKDPKIIGSVYGNMQCMLKGVCAQCLQWQIDPETGQRTKAVFACSWQDQPLEIIDIDHMEARQMQNGLLDQINNLWVDYLFEKHLCR
jgi:NADPH-dependent glutamate synthase beta subunit-like oxidoreductase/NAD(P)H-flavin reductase